MKNFWKIAKSLGILCFIGACGIFFLNALAVIAASFGFMGLFSYFQLLRLPYWSIALPALGILAFAPLALREAFASKPTPEEEKAAPMDWRRFARRRRTRFRLRPA
jgi:hypothetical protein